MSIQSLLFPTRDLCYLCKEKTPYIKEFTCCDCKDKLAFLNREIDIDSIYISRTFYSLNYNRFLRELIHGFKFNGKSYLYKPFAEIMLDTISQKNILDIDLIIYIPIHRRKEAIRGYNQSELLAGYISKNLNKPMSNGNLVKTKWTKEQNTLDRIQRFRNLKDSFSIRNPNEFEDKRILLIDDIITTGSTFNECAKLLIENGAKEIFAIALTSSKTT